MIEIIIKVDGETVAIEENSSTVESKESVKEEPQKAPVKEEKKEPVKELDLINPTELWENNYALSTSQAVAFAMVKNFSNKEFVEFLKENNGDTEVGINYGNINTLKNYYNALTGGYMATPLIAEIAERILQGNFRPRKAQSAFATNCSMLTMLKAIIQIGAGSKLDWRKEEMKK